MKNFLLITVLISAAALASLAYAQTANDEAIKADVQALDKDNAALTKDQKILEKDRAAKAADKVNDDNGKQAVDSVKIGTVKTAIEEKKIEKAADEKILEKHKEDMNKDVSGPTSTSDNP